MPFFPPPSSSSRVHVGRGGAANIASAKRSPLSISSAASTHSSQSTTNAHANVSTASTKAGSQRSFTGRGGAGNAHPVAEFAIFSFDEELQNLKRAHEHLAPVYHIGRGGGGNAFGEGRGGSGW